jgi:alpha,alpha-trehalose phosphorylase (configuration-retaining)
MWAGIAGSPVNNNTEFEIAISIHDSVYSTDFASLLIPFTPGQLEKTSKDIEQHVLETLRKFSVEVLFHFLLLCLISISPSISASSWAQE